MTALNEKALQGKADLLRILAEAVLLLALPGNDFLWSFWEGPEQATAELLKYRQQIGGDDFSCLPVLQVIFAASGSLQEVSISSGWGPAFVELAGRFDQALLLLGE